MSSRAVLAVFCLAAGFLATADAALAFGFGLAAVFLAGALGAGLAAVFAGAFAGAFGVALGEASRSCT